MSDRDRLMSHGYDGIREYDNPLPGWWVWIFWATIVFSIGYWAYYQMGPGPSIVAQYEAEMQAVAERQPKAQWPSAVTDASLAALEKDAAVMAKAKEISSPGAHPATEPIVARAWSGPTSRTNTGCTAAAHRDPKPSARACPRRAWSPGRTSSRPRRSPPWPPTSARCAAPTRLTPSRRRATTPRSRLPGAARRLTRRLDRMTRARVCPPESRERVLPTLNLDGTRRWMRPKLFEGRFLRRRRALAWALIGLFTALPYLRMGGSPSSCSMSSTGASRSSARPSCRPTPCS